MRERFLIRPDRWATVAHWKNYTGKATYFVERVIAAERLAEFSEAFIASVTRRRLTSEQVDTIIQNRARVDAVYREWLKGVSPEDVRRMLALNEVAAIFDAARAIGYRTPHK